MSEIKPHSERQWHVRIGRRFAAFAWIRSEDEGGVARRCSLLTIAALPLCHDA
jgi:hypothetical protein